MLSTLLNLSPSLKYLSPMSGTRRNHRIPILHICIGNSRKNRQQILSSARSPESDFKHNRVLQILASMHPQESCRTSFPQPMQMCSLRHELSDHFPSWKLWQKRLPDGGSAFFPLPDGGNAKASCWNKPSKPKGRTSASASACALQPAPCPSLHLHTREQLHASTVDWWQARLNHPCLAPQADARSAAKPSTRSTPRCGRPSALHTSGRKSTPSLAIGPSVDLCWSSQP